jgi:hypothetical protein
MTREANSGWTFKPVPTAVPPKGSSIRPSVGHHALPVQPLYRFPAGSGLGLGREQTEDKLSEEIFIARSLPDMAKLSQPGLNLPLYGMVKVH